MDSPQVKITLGLKITSHLGSLNTYRLYESSKVDNYPEISEEQNASISKD